MIINVVLTHATTNEQRSLVMEGQSWGAIRKAARDKLDCPYPDWAAAYTFPTTPAPVKVVKAKRDLPSISDLARKSVCPECGGEVVRRSAKGPMPVYCSDPVKNCKKVRGNRRLVRGAAIIEFAQAWRINRAQGEVAQGSFRQMCQILDQFNAEDNDAGRPRADLCAAKILADGSLYFDRQRAGPRRERAKEEKAAETPAPDLSALRAKVEDDATTDNERAILAAALEIMTAKAA